MAEKKWYVIHTYSGYENRVRDSLESLAEQQNLEDKFGKIFIPTEEVAEIKDGKKNITTKKVFPGYILMEMDLDDDIWYLVKNTPGVTGFVGPGRQPVPIPQEEVDEIVTKMEETGERPRPRISFETGTKVRIVEGPFQNFTGYISNIDNERGRLRIMVDILGRSTPVDLDFLQVEKL
jgi:transcriptional antiterminator NusG